MVLYILSRDQFVNINKLMPSGHSFGYKNEDDIYIFDSDVRAYYDFDLDFIVEEDSFDDFLGTLDIYSEDEKITMYRIGKYADKYYKDTPFNLFDFKRMLKRGLSANKQVNMQPSGRPGLVTYYLNDEVVAYIYFTFTLNSDGLITRRLEELTYVKEDDTESPRITIKDKTYDLTDPSITDATIVLEERIRSRRNVIGNMKMIAGAVLKVALNFNLEQVSNYIEPFWSEFGVERIDFIDLGSDGFKNKLAAIDLQSTEFSWLAFPVMEGVNIRDFMLNALVQYHDSALGL